MIDYDTYEYFCLQFINTSTDVQRSLSGTVDQSGSQKVKQWRSN